jgi:glucose-6-phosphate 1-dehydrogenase
MQNHTTPHIFVIFGASGDLARRKLIPAIYDLYQQGLLPEQFAVLGVSRSEYSDQAFREMVFLSNEFLDLSHETDEIRKKFNEKLFYVAIDTLEPDGYALVKSKLTDLDSKLGTAGNYIFYLSTPPMLYELIPAYLAAQGLNKSESGWRRLVIEKPFGHDLESARKLNTELKRYFAEEQIYRIDHYLGKETVQNMLVTRFANGVFEPLWNRNYIHHIQITSAEDIGVGSRGGYYDSSGAMRDMLQNHLMQVVAHVAMEPPIGPTATHIRNEKAKLFQSLRPITREQVATHVIRGQYLSADIGGKVVKGYREENGVPADSKTETYVAMKFFVDNWRWSNVPFYVRTGKRLPTKVAEVVITFKKPPHTIFQQTTSLDQEHNQLVLRIQPDEGLLLNVGMKVPGEGFKVENVGMDFHYSDLAREDIPTAYERLLMDCMNGDATLYAHGRSVEYTWKFVEPILEAWTNDPEIPIYGYPAGSWGPDIADNLIETERMGWRNPCRKLTQDTSFCTL